MIDSYVSRSARIGRLLLGFLLALTVGCAGKTLQYKDDHDRILRIDQAVVAEATVVTAASVPPMLRAVLHMVHPSNRERSVDAVGAG